MPKAQDKEPHFEQYEYLPGQPHFRAKWQKGKNPASPGTLAYHEEEEIHLVKSGRGTYFVRDAIYEFGPGSVLAIPPGTPHRGVIPPGAYVEKVTLMFPLSLLGAKLGRSVSGLPHVFKPQEEDFTDLEVAARIIVSESRLHKACWEESLSLELSRLILLLCRAAESSAADAKESHPIMDWCLSYVEENFRTLLSLENMAAKAGYSQFHLARIFKRCTGLGVKQFALHRRVIEARKLLSQEPLLTIEALALRLGFTNLSHFNRCFKKIAKMTPGQYRTMMHGGGPEESLRLD